MTNHNFNPLQEKGIPLEKQTSSWKDLSVIPYERNQPDLYMRASIILMNAVEVEAALFSHQFTRCTTDLKLRQKLAVIRRIELEQQKTLNWLLPPDDSFLEITIGYEQFLVELTAALASTETDLYAKACLDFALLENFDHLYRFANLLTLEESKDPIAIVKQDTEISIGRPTFLEHRHPFDDVRNYTNYAAASILTKLHFLTALIAEQQTLNFYINIGNRSVTELGRSLYQEIAQVKEQHVTHYETLIDPTISWFENLLLHEYNECYLYYSLLQMENDEKIRPILEKHLAMEIEHLRIAAQFLEIYEHKDAAELLPKNFPPLFKFQSNIEYIRSVLKGQIDCNALGPKILEADKFFGDVRYVDYQRAVNHRWIPSEILIQNKTAIDGKDYRLEIAGPHPIKKYRR